LGPIGEVVEQLRLGQVIDLVVEIFADAPDRPRIGVDG